MAKQGRKRINRAIALAASLVIAVGLVPAPAIAAGAENELGGLASEASPAAAAPDAAPSAQGDEGAAPGEQPAEVEKAGAEGGEAGAEASGNGKDGPGADSADPGGDEAADSDGDKDRPSGKAEEADADGGGGKSAASNKGKDSDSKNAKGGKAESPAFVQSATVGCVTVTVEADAGVFPEGARLSVAGVPSSATEAAVAAERKEGVNVAASYTFDVKVLDADGQEIQPADGKSVKVSFKAAEVADPNLDVSVYHVADGAACADQLGVDVSGAIATAESDGFSYYTVEFTYGELQYVLQGGGKVALADILAAVDLSGEVTGVEVSDQDLFSASEEEGGWVVTSHKAFSTSEWMRVTIGGKVYEIEVTDSQTGKCGDNLTWALEGNTLTISGTGAMWDYKPREHPWEGSLENITRVDIGDGVTSIGDFAFYYYENLLIITIPESMTSIGDKAFSHCEQLYFVNTIPEGMTNIGREAFADCIRLRNVYYNGTKGEWDALVEGKDVFKDCSPQMNYNYCTVTFVDDDGKMIEGPTKYPYGTEAAEIARPADPTKKADAQYTYTFKGWTPEIADVTADATYTATYDKTLNKYEVAFVNDDGTVLQSGEVEYGKTPAYTGKTPAKAADEKCVYEFAGWTPELAPVTGDTSYKATYEAKDKYACADGSGLTWTKGSTDPLTLTIKGAIDDAAIIDLFEGVEVDGKAVPQKDSSGNPNWKAEKGSLILSLQPSFLETLSAGKHTVTAVFDDGSASATFTVEAKASPAPASDAAKGASSSSLPKTGDETGRTVAVLSVTAAAALCLALFALSQRKRRKPARAGKHARR